MAQIKRQSIRPKIRFSVFQRDNYTCQLCGKSSQLYNIELEVDHKIPVSKGGTNKLSNLWTLCKLCNRGKSVNLVTKTLELEVYSIVAGEKPIRKKQIKAEPSNKFFAQLPVFEPGRDANSSINKLAFWRVTRQLTIRELAVKARINPATVNRIETGKVKATLLTLGKLAQALEVPLSELEELSENPEHRVEISN